MNDARKQISALSRTAQAPVTAVPDGWKLVPVKLPDEMASIISKFVQGRAIPTSIEGLNSERDEVYFDNGHARELWNKVVSASPLPAAPVSHGGGRGE